MDIYFTAHLGAETVFSSLLPLGSNAMTSLYDSITQAPRLLPSGRPLTWYTCGPTVYDHAHIGHARTFVQLDIMRRALTWLGQPVCYALNITDIDDKILAKARALGISPQAHAQSMEASFWRDMEALGVGKPDYVTRVTEYIPKIIAYIEKLVALGFATQGDDGVYFDHEYFTATGHRLPDWAGGADSERADFALWKLKPEGWDSPWGKGRPGWHIECTVMSHDVLGSHIDVHSGGIDLKFPHHHNELAQSQCLEGQHVDTFVHIGHLEIQGRKMSKSLKNFITVQEMLRLAPARALRIAFALTHWRKSLHYSEDVISEAIAIDRALASWFSDYELRLRQKVAEEQPDLLTAVLQELLRDNLQYDQALQAILDFMAQSRQGPISRAVYTRLLSNLQDIFGLDYHPKFVLERNSAALLDVIVQERQRLRVLSKELRHPALFASTDRIRDRYRDLGVQIEDTANESVWKLVH
jgi:cysteinyl-tRNA synthetase